MREMVDVPTSWLPCKFGDIARIRNGYAFKSQDFIKHEPAVSDVPLIRQSQLKGDVVDLTEAVFLPGRFLAGFPNYVLRRGDIIIGMSGSIGHICRYTNDSPALQNQRTGKIELLSQGAVDVKFFGLYLSSVEAELISKGMGVQNISSKDIEGLSLGLPPVSEQRRIIAKIEELFSELDKGVESLTIAREQLKVYRQAVLKHAFEGKLTAGWRSKNPQRAEVAESLHARAPAERQPNAEAPDSPQIQTYQGKEWVWLRLGDVSHVSGGLTKNPKRNALSRTMKYLRVANVYADRLDLSDVAEIGVTDAEFDKLNLTRGDLLVVEGNGSVDQIGRVAIWKCELANVGHQNHLIRVRLKSGMSPQFFQSFLMSPVGRELIVKQASSTSGLHTLSISKVSGLPVPVPSTQEQEQILLAIAGPLSEIEKLDEECALGIAKCAALRQSILKKAFSGNLMPRDSSEGTTLA